MSGFIVNRHGRIVFPQNFFPRLDFGVFAGLEDFEAVIKRDFDGKCRTHDDLVARATSGHYRSRYELLRDVVSNLYWSHRYALTMYEKRPTRWRDTPRASGPTSTFPSSRRVTPDRSPASWKPPTAPCRPPGMRGWKTPSSGS